MSMMQMMQVAEWAWCKRCKLHNEHDANDASCIMSMMQTMQVAEWAWCKRCKHGSVLCFQWGDIMILLMILNNNCTDCNVLYIFQENTVNMRPPNAISIFHDFCFHWFLGKCTKQYNRYSCYWVS
jgi:hypothetical protein